LTAACGVGKTRCPGLSANTLAAENQTIAKKALTLKRSRAGVVATARGILDFNMAPFPAGIESS
jgi:hypothetical protein